MDNLKSFQARVMASAKTLSKSRLGMFWKQHVKEAEVLKVRVRVVERQKGPKLGRD